MQDMADTGFACVGDKRKPDDQAGTSSPKRPRREDVCPLTPPLTVGAMLDATFTPESYVPPDIYCDARAVRETLNLYGVAVVRGAVDAAGVERLHGAHALDFGQQTPPIAVGEDAPWRAYDPRHGAMYNWGEGGAMGFMNLARVLAAPTWAKVWDVAAGELLSSLDGFAYGVAPERSGRQGGYENAKKAWLHSDERPGKVYPDGRPSIQGLVNVNDATAAGAATTRVLLASHGRIGALQDAFGFATPKIDWFKLNPEHVAWYEALGCHDVRVPMGPGDMIFWHSSTIHSGSRPVAGRVHAVDRFVAYVTMSPRDPATPACMKKRVAAFENKRTMTHSPKYGRLFGMKPRTYPGAPEPLLLRAPTDPFQSLVGQDEKDLLRRLVGYVE